MNENNFSLDFDKEKPNKTGDAFLDSLSEEEKDEYFDLLAEEAMIYFELQEGDR